VPGGSGCGIPRNGGWTGLAFAFFPERGLATHVGLHQRLAWRSLRRFHALWTRWSNCGSDVIAPRYRDGRSSR
jgi:hypothetical protein